DWNNKAMADYLVVGKGYSVQMNQPQTAMFSGVLNSSPVTSTLLKQNPGVDPNRVGWNLLGNPFSSAIDWDLTDHSSIDASVYVWNGTQYVSWNGTTGALTGGIIPAENAFFAKTMVNGTSLSIPLFSRVHSGIGFYKSAITDLLELTVDGNSYTDKTFVHFNNQATAGFDMQYDAYKLFGNSNTPQLYSMITGDVLSINELPMAGNEVVNLGFKCNTTGIYTVSAQGTDNFLSSVPVFLQDMKLDVTQDLRLNPVYSFSYVAGENENRFRLLFLDATGMKEDVKFVIYVYSFDKTVVIENPGLLSGDIRIFDVTGRELYSQKLTGDFTTHIPLRFVSGTYIVKVISEKAAVTTKVHIR
ncbi:MAG: T9SS type A sorting domain-containing protein, partial [Bacteroidota bacterium]